MQQRHTLEQHQPRRARAQNRTRHQTPPLIDRTNHASDARPSANRQVTTLSIDSLGARAIAQTTRSAPGRSCTKRNSPGKDNLSAFCQACHLHYDRGHHAHTRATTRADTLTAMGQGVLDWDEVTA
jgi:hypothetical protein